MFSLPKRCPFCLIYAFSIILPWAQIDHDRKSQPINIYISRESSLMVILYNFFSLSAGKSDHYAELIVDGEPPRKTEIARKTQEPKWDELFTV